ncbi:PHP domain-containing protein [Candidatus Halobonum tyrrellensis]|uniref:histidinol-phosphatase n=1 Tax=Candidatus Halobonum tyrrellensis G22 TaxID=1324957 RepID=V4HC50_9EURY|nr:PHP domain-containing protein [Candidatus Halobonum tyrrellensis]ESP87633.1 PHP family phosphohydrolase, histidinol phosphatase [Candidatus Halobonum tyrrellensis G22]
MERLRDFHAHSNYSDGRFLDAMVAAAEDAGLDGVGFADHCNVSAREEAREYAARYGFNLDVTHERRRRAIRRVREDASVAVYDAVEMDYDPRDETEIRAFLADAEFDYSLGSVHAVDGANVQVAANFESMDDADRDAVVDRYFERLLALIRSDLFDVAAHVDLPERTPPLRGRATDEQYRRVARAFADSRTVPEVNAGRALTESGVVHPAPAFLDALREEGVPVTVGTDAHVPDELRERAAFLDDFLAERGLDPVEPDGV